MPLSRDQKVGLAQVGAGVGLAGAAIPAGEGAVSRAANEAWSGRQARKLEQHVTDQPSFGRDRRQRYDVKTGQRMPSRQEVARGKWVAEHDRLKAAKPPLRGGRGRALDAALFGAGLVGGAELIRRGGKKLREVEKADRRTSIDLAAQGAAGAGLVGAGFGNRVPDVVHGAGLRIAAWDRKRFDAGIGRTGAVKEGKPVDPRKLNHNRAKVRIDAQGRPQGRPRSELQEARHQYNVRNDKVIRRGSFLTKRPKFGSRAAAIVGLGGLGGAMSWDAARQLAGRDEKLAKTVTRRDVDNAAVGGMVGGAAYHAPSYLIETPLRQHYWRKKIDANPNLKRIEDEHGKKTGAIGTKGRKGMAIGERGWVEHNRTLPKLLPGAGTRRTLAYTHAGKTGMAATAVVAGAAGAGNALYRRHKDGEVLSKAYESPAGYASDIGARPLGIPASRTNPISPLAILGPTNIMADFLVGAAGKNLNRRQKRAVRQGAYGFAGARGMLYSPLGFGRSGVAM